MPDRAEDSLRIGMVGHGFMGRAHALAWRLADQAFELPAKPVLAVVAGRDERRSLAAAGQLGFAEAVSDWRLLIDRSDLDVIDICTPVNLHAEIAEAALAAGKHVLCEKPLALTAAEARRLARAAAAARSTGAVAMVGYNYRRVPAVQLARTFVAEARIGEIRHVRARYLQDWLAGDDSPWSWRLDVRRAGAGALGDIGSHLIDLIAFVTGQRIREVTGSLETFVPSRTTGSSDGRRPHHRPVTVDDACQFLARLADGTMAVFEAARTAPGRKNQLSFEINGSEGSLAFNLERLNELQLYRAADDQAARGFQTILVTEPVHPYLEGWWPPGHTLGWDHTFVHQARDFILAAAGRQPCAPDFADGLYVQQVIESVARSARTGSWETVGQQNLADSLPRRGRPAAARTDGSPKQAMTGTSP
jgi:predicted dehydrogenase